ncbi:MAG: hypothetical protein QXJ64_10740 [Thermosphaera sp.]
MHDRILVNDAPGSKSIAESVVDVVFLGRFRVFNVGIIAYSLWIISYVFMWLRDVLLGMPQYACFFFNSNVVCIPIYLGGILVFIFFIAWAGSSIVPIIDYVSATPKYRLVYGIVYETTSILIKHKTSFPKLSRRVLVSGLLTLNGLISVWLWILYNYDPAFIATRTLVSASAVRGALVILLHFLNLTPMILFWNAAAIVFLHILYAYYWFLHTLINSMRREVETMDSLSLSELFEKVIYSERPGLLFMKYWQQLHKPMEYLLKIIKRIIVALISAIIIPYIGDILTGQSSLSVGTISGIFIGIGLSVPLVYLTMVILRNGSILKNLISVELEDVKIKGLLQGDERLESVAEEIKALLSTLGSPLIELRDLIELVVAIVTLLTTIITILLNLSQ